jgi:hypothetical protein
MTHKGLVTAPALTLAARRSNRPGNGKELDDAAGLTFAGADSVKRMASEVENDRLWCRRSFPLRIPQRGEGREPITCRSGCDAAYRNQSQTEANPD